MSETTLPAASARVWNVPNQVTVSRLALAVLLFALMELQWYTTSLVVVLGDISRRLPETVILTKVNFWSATLRRYAPSSIQKPAVPAIAETAATTPEKQDDRVSTVTLITMTAFANEVSEAIRCAAVLERSPLVAHVQMELKGEAVWSGRKGHQFELACELMDQSGTHP
jgi:hypothetical protein